MITCPKCEEQQWSLMDKKYLDLFGQCWDCDKKLWEEHKLSTEEFERREDTARKCSDDTGEEDEQGNPY
jgi:hypothetical protein